MTESDSASDQQRELPLATRDERASGEGGAESPVVDEQLMEEVGARANLQAALRQVRSNRGSAGVDGRTVDELPAYLRRHWPQIREQLLTGQYQPQPLKRVEIPKPEGGVRKVGIPRVLDRFRQPALLQGLQPRWDPTFAEHRYGVRPGRSAFQAVGHAPQYLRAGYRGVVEIDLEKFFDRVNPDKRMGEVEKRLRDQRVLALIRRYLKAGVLAEGLGGARDEGTPQGGPLTPPTMLPNVP
jgi:RNA-directed DNA polymerase